MSPSPTRSASASSEGSIDRSMHRWYSRASSPDPSQSSVQAAPPAEPERMVIRRDVAELRLLVDELLDEPRACDSVHARVFASDPVHRSSYLYPRPESVARARRYA